MSEIIGRPFFQYVKIPPDLSFGALAALDYLQFSINKMCSLWPLCIFWSRFLCLIQKPSVPTSRFRYPPSPPFSVRSSPTSLFPKPPTLSPSSSSHTGLQCLLTCRGRPSNLILQWKDITPKVLPVQFSHSVVSNTLPLHGLQHARPPCPSPTPRVHPNSCPLSRWCHPTSYPLSSPSPPALNLSQHQGHFKWVSSSHQVAKVLEFQPQHQSFQWTPRTDPLGWTGWISLQSKGLSRVFSNTKVQKHQFFHAQFSL